MKDEARSIATTSAFTGLILLFFGYFYGVVPATDLGPVYSFLFQLFNYAVWVGGVGILVAAGGCFTGSTIGLVLDAFLSALSGIAILICVVGWAFFEKSIDGFGLIAGLLALILLREGYTVGTRYLRIREKTGRTKDTPTSQPAPTPTRVISSAVLPKSDAPPPPEGYLAALAKEKDDDSQRAAHE